MIRVAERHAHDEAPLLVKLRHESLATAVTDEAWQMAQERVLLYLKTLQRPPLQALHLAVEAIERARGSGGSADASHPVAAAMRALRELLKECPNPTGAMNADALAGSLAAVPPLNRGPMVPEQWAQRPRHAWLARLSLYLKRARPAAPGSGR
jgi:hypothetical protein